MAEENEIKSMNNSNHNGSLNGNGNLFSNNATASSSNNNVDRQYTHYVEPPPMNHNGKMIIVI